MSVLVARARAVVRWMTDTPHATAGLSLLRALIGLISTAFYLGAYADRGLLFGPDGVYGTQGIRDYASGIGTWTVYGASPSPALFEVLFHLGLVLAVLVFLGIGGRPVLAAHYVFMWSLYMANPSIMDGGDALAAIAAVFLLFTRCYSSFTVRQTRGSEAPSAMTAAMNNTGLLLLATQVCIVYLMAGLYKVQGELWQDGTALYYILSVPEFYWPGITPFLTQFDWVLVLGAYGTVLTSVFFPVLVFFRAGRPVAVAAMLLFHLAIAVLMGLTSFALVMAAFDLLFVSAHVERLRVRARAGARAVFDQLRSMLRGRRSGEGSIEDPRALARERP